MLNTWGSSWGSSWGDSWGLTVRAYAQVTIQAPSISVLVVSFVSTVAAPIQVQSLTAQSAKVVPAVGVVANVVVTAAVPFGTRIKNTSALVGQTQIQSLENYGVKTCVASVVTSNIVVSATSPQIVKIQAVTALTGSVQISASAPQPWRLKIQSALIAQVAINAPTVIDSARKVGVVQIAQIVISAPSIAVQGFKLAEAFAQLQITTPTILTSSFKVRSTNLAQISVASTLTTTYKTKIGSVQFGAVYIQQVGVTSVVSLKSAQMSPCLVYILSTGHAGKIRNVFTIPAQVAITGVGQANGYALPIAFAQVVVQGVARPVTIKGAFAMINVAVVGTAVTSTLRSRPVFGQISITCFANGGDANPNAEPLVSVIQVLSYVFATKTLRRFKPIYGSTMGQEVGLTRISTGQLDGSASLSNVELDDATPTLL